MKKFFSLPKIVLIAIFILLGSLLIVEWVQENTKLSRRALDVNNNSALLATWALGSPIDALTANSDLAAILSMVLGHKTCMQIDETMLKW